MEEKIQSNISKLISELDVNLRYFTFYKEGSSEDMKPIPPMISISIEPKSKEKELNGFWYLMFDINLSKDLSEVILIKPFKSKHTKYDIPFQNAKLWLKENEDKLKEKITEGLNSKIKEVASEKKYISLTEFNDLVFNNNLNYDTSSAGSFIFYKTIYNGVEYCSETEPNMKINKELKQCLIN